jgi:hypothetical protein
MPKNKKEIAFSLLMPTLGRIMEVDRLFSNLLSTQLKELIEIVVIDQNDIGFGVKKLCEKYADKLNIIYIHSDII